MIAKNDWFPRKQKPRYHTTIQIEKSIDRALVRDTLLLKQMSELDAEYDRVRKDGLVEEMIVNRSTYDVLFSKRSRLLRRLQKLKEQLSQLRTGMLPGIEGDASIPK